MFFHTHLSDTYIHTYIHTKYLHWYIIGAFIWAGYGSGGPSRNHLQLVLGPEQQPISLSLCWQNCQVRQYLLCTGLHEFTIIYFSLCFLYSVSSLSECGVWMWPCLSHGWPYPILAMCTVCASWLTATRSKVPPWPLEPTMVISESGALQKAHRR